MTGFAPIPQFAFIDDLAPFLFLLFMGASALFNWLKKRQEQKEAEKLSAESTAGRQTASSWEQPDDLDDTEYAAPVGVESPSPAQPPARSWEEELKRLLEGDFSNPPPAQKAEPPPLPEIVVVPTPPPQPQVRREPVRRPARASALPALPAIFSRRGQTEDSPSHETHAGYGHLKPLRHAAKAYDRATHLSDLVAAKLAAMDSKTAFLPPETKAIRRRVRSKEMASVLKLLRTPDSARQIIIAQTVLGQPKGLEV